MKNGALCISFDFELYWGLLGACELESYKRNLLGVYEVVPRMLELFERREIHSTWAAVGLLLAEDLDDARQYFPDVRPEYVEYSMSPYKYLARSDVSKRLSADKEFARCHFAPELVQAILRTPGQELATHTFSHYYCLEQGQEAVAFSADLLAARRIAEEKYACTPRSIIFPRHQTNQDYLKACYAAGITAYRGNQAGWFYRETTFHSERLCSKLLKHANSYCSLTGANTVLPIAEDSGLINVAASAQLRAYRQRLSFLDGLKLKRIKRSMLYAAQRKEVCHIWWHPHNFGGDIPESLAYLRQIVDYYQELHDRFGMQSQNMHELAVAEV